jgi:hypothetical protein
MEVKVNLVSFGNLALVEGFSLGTFPQCLVHITVIYAQRAGKTRADLSGKDGMKNTSLLPV